MNSLEREGFVVLGGPITGMADSRQWNNEFAYFSKDFQVLRYDMRGYGKSEPVTGEFTHLEDLTGLLDYLDNRQPSIMMGVQWVAV